MKSERASRDSRPARKNKEFNLSRRITVFVTVLVSGMVLIAEGLVKILASLFMDEKFWLVLVGTAFILLAMLLDSRLFQDIRKFLKKK